MAVCPPIPSNNPAEPRGQAAHLGRRASRPLVSPAPPLSVPLAVNGKGCGLRAGRPRSQDTCAPLSFRRVKSRRLTLIAVRRIFPFFFRRTEKCDELAEIDIDHRRRVEGQKLR